MDNRVSDERSRALLLFLNKLHMILQPYYVKALFQSNNCECIEMVIYI